MKRVLIDCDPGLDDAVALLAAFGAPDLKILAITTVAGNVRGGQTAMNARIIRESAGAYSSIPICAGAPGPLLRELVTAEDFHGGTGLGDLPFPAPSEDLSSIHAVNMIIQECQAARADPITIIITGPMTNIALALRMSPDIMDGIEEIVLMGGAHLEGGNITPFAEFNIFADPHAAAIVFGSGISIRCLNLDATHQVRTSAERLQKVRDVGTPQAQVAADLLEASCKLEFSANGEREAPLHDPSTILALTHGELFAGRPAFVTVVLEDGEQFGRTIPEFQPDGNVLWYETVNAEAVFDGLCEHLGGFG